MKKLKTRTKIIKERIIICECGQEFPQGAYNCLVSICPKTNNCDITISFDCPKCMRSKQYKGTAFDTMYLISDIKIECNCASCRGEVPYA